MIKCKCVQWDGSRTAVAGASGAVLGAWGGTMAKAAGVIMLVAYHYLKK